jgi:glutathione synthase/RimK-type ligase-like ATP-grasp enzyme
MKPNRKMRRKSAAIKRPIAAVLDRDTNASVRKGVLFSALPTDQRIAVKVGANGKPMMVLPGRIVLTSEMKEALNRTADELWHPEIDERQLQGADWLLNMLADPDRYREALEYLDSRLVGFDNPIFNHPRAVLNTSRDVVWKTLKDVNHLTAPKCVRFSPTNPNDFLSTFRDSGFSYPVLIRPAGTHTGKEMLLISSEKHWNEMFSMAWGGRELYMTQWVDFRNDQGEWRKIRLSVTPDHIAIRHILYGDGWLIHAMERGPEEADRELAVIEKFEDWERLKKLGAEVRDRVGLDFFGIDLGWKSEEEFVLFEANASMSIISRVSMPTHRREEYEAVVAGIEKDVWRALASRWS